MKSLSDAKYVIYFLSKISELERSVYVIEDINYTET